MSGFRDATPSGWTGRQVLVTGATGFVGSHIVRELLGAGAAVRALVRRTADRSRLSTIGATCVEGEVEDLSAVARACDGCEIVFHAAGLVHFGEDWDLFRRVNVNGTRHVLQAARSAGVRRLVHTSSIVAVGASTRPEVLDEDARWDLDRLAVPYVTTKRLAEDVALEAACGGLDVVVVNPASVVGPGDLSRSLFGTWCHRFWRGNIPFYFGGGNCYVDVRDVAAGHLLASERGRPGARYILGGENMSYGEFLRSLACAAGRPIFRLRLPTCLSALVARLNDRLVPGQPRRAYMTAGQARLMGLYFYFSSARARQELGYRARPLATSLTAAYQFWSGPEAGR